MTSEKAKEFLQCIIDLESSIRPIGFMYACWHDENSDKKVKDIMIKAVEALDEQILKNKLFCPKCNEDISITDNYCSNCGHAINN